MQNLCNLVKFESKFFFKLLKGKNWHNNTEKTVQRVAKKQRKDHGSPTGRQKNGNETAVTF